jgi:hypothetical protein
MAAKSGVGSLRSITVGAKVEHRVEVVEYQGLKFEVRSPSVGARSKILESARKADDTGEAAFDFGLFRILAVVHLTHDPESGEKVFSVTDVPAMLESPTGGYVDVIGAVAEGLINVDPDETAKN